MVLGMLNQHGPFPGTCQAAAHRYWSSLSDMRRRLVGACPAISCKTLHIGPHIWRRLKQCVSPKLPGMPGSFHMCVRGAV